MEWIPFVGYGLVALALISGIFQFISGRRERRLERSADKRDAVMGQRFDLLDQRITDTVGSLDQRITDTFGSLDQRITDTFGSLSARLTRVETKLDGLQDEIHSMDKRLVTIEPRS